jgi:hypothetical protein
MLVSYSSIRRNDTLSEIKTKEFPPLYPFGAEINQANFGPLRKARRLYKFFANGKCRSQETE